MSLNSRVWNPHLLITYDTSKNTPSPLNIMYVKHEIPASLAGLSPGQTDMESFAAAVGVDTTLAGHIIKWWHAKGVGRIHGNTCTYAPGERLEAAIMLLEDGTNMDDVTCHIHWRDFEGLAGHILESEGYDVMRNHIMTKPRMEIDVLGTRLGMAILVDCKHWRRSSGLARAATLQMERAQRWTNDNHIPCIPVIVTLLEHAPLPSGIPVVSISRFRSFASEIFGNADDIMFTPET